MADGFVGSAWVQIQPSFVGFQRAVSREVGKVGGTAGRQLGNALGAGMKTAANLGGVAAVAVGGMGVQAARAAMRVDELDVAMRAVGRSSGVSYPTMQRTAQAVKDQGIQMASAQEVAIAFARANLDMSKASDLARVAQDAAVIAQVDSTEATDRLMHGIQTLSPIVLRQLGITVDANAAYDKYGKTIGKTRLQLSQQEKQQAFLNEVLSQGGKIAGTYEAAMEQPGKVIRSFPRLFNDAAVTIGQGFTPALGKAIKPMYDLTKEITKALAPGGKLRPIVDAIGDAVTRLLDPVRNAVTAMRQWFDALDPGRVKAIANVIRDFAPQIAAVGTALAAMTAGKVVSGLPGVGKAFGSMAGPLSAITGKIGKFIDDAGGLGNALGKLPKAAKLATGGLGIFLALLAASPELREVVMELAQYLLDALMPAFRQMFDAVKPLLPLVADLAGMLGQQLAGVIEALLPAIVPLAELLADVLVMAVEAFADVLKPLLPIITDLAKILGDVLIPVIDVLQPVFLVMADTMDLLRPIIKPLIYAVMGLTAAVYALGVAFAITPLGWVVIGIAAVVAAVVLLVKHWDKVVAAVRAAAAWIWDKALKPAFEGIKTGLAAVGGAFSWLYDVAIKPVFDAIKVAVDAVAGAFVWFYQTVILPVWRGIQAAFQVAWAIIRPIYLVWRTLMLLILAVWIAVFLGIVWAWRGIVAAAQWAWSTVLKPIFAAIMATVRFVGGVFSWLWRNVVSPVWLGIRAAISFAWNAIIKPILAALQATVRTVGGWFTWLNRNVVQPVWSAIRGAISFAWNSVIKPILSGLRTAIQWTGDKINWLYTNVVKPVWDKIGGAIKWAWERVIRPVINAFRDAPGKVAEAWEKTVKTIGDIWDKIKGFVRKPVEFVVEKILNPLFRGANKLLSKVGLEIPEIKLPKMQQGGRVPGGWGGGDRQLILAEPGEWMLTKRQAKGIGYGNLARLPRFAEGGLIGGEGPSARRPWYDPRGWVPGALKGMGDLLKWGADQILSPVGGLIRAAAAEAFRLATVPLKKLAEPMTKAPVPDQFWAQAFGKFVVQGIDKVVEFIRGKSDEGTFEGTIAGVKASEVIKWAVSKLGSRYVWAAKGPNTFDCSGLVQWSYAKAGIPGIGPDTFQQVTKGRPIPRSVPGLRPADLIFWGKPTTYHVALSMGGNRIIHSPQPGDVVRYANLYGDWYARRIIEEVQVPGGTGMGRWGPMIQQALQITRYPVGKSVSDAVGAIQYIMKGESGGNPRAINNYDVNWRNGNPSIGLMQLTMSNMRHYTPPQLRPRTWTRADYENPLIQLTSAINYMKERYGGIMQAQAVWQRQRWYDQGGWLPPGVTTVVNNTGRPEPVLSPGQWDAVQRNGGNAARNRDDEVRLLKQIVRLLQAGHSIEIDREPVAAAVAAATLYGAAP